MTERRAQMLADRHLRNSARALVEADIENLKADFNQKTLGERAFDRVREGALDVYEEALDVAENNKGALAALIAAIVVWFSRNPILSLLGIEEGEEDEEPSTDDE